MSNGNHARPGGMGPTQQEAYRMALEAKRNAYQRYAPAFGAQYFKRSALHSSLWLIRVVTSNPAMMVDHSG